MSHDWVLKYISQKYKEEIQSKRRKGKPAVRHHQTENKESVDVVELVDSVDTITEEEKEELSNFCYRWFKKNYFLFLFYG